MRCVPWTHGTVSTCESVTATVLIDIDVRFRRINKEYALYDTLYIIQVCLPERTNKRCSHAPPLQFGVNAHLWLSKRWREQVGRLRARVVLNLGPCADRARTAATHGTCFCCDSGDPRRCVTGIPWEGARRSLHLSHCRDGSLDRPPHQGGAAERAHMNTHRQATGMETMEARSGCDRFAVVAAKEELIADWAL